ncbi:MAG: ABC transporter permease [Clostridia bacterium]|nr:ABC transporter permease [Clostridia bacterium]
METNGVQKHKNFFQKLLTHPGFRSFAAALICILIGLLIGYIVLLIINPAHAGEGMSTILKNFMTRNSEKLRTKAFGNTLVKTAPLLLCSLSILFAYKAGLFNIGAAGQYVLGTGAALYCALALNMPWYVCLIAAVLAGALFGAISGALKAYLNVNEVISCIMLNWISLYTVNSVLKDFCPVGYKDTHTLTSRNPSALLPTLGLDKLLGNDRVTVAIPIAILIAVFIWIILTKTKFGYEIKATGYNRNAAKYCGMREKQNIILTMVIAGSLAGLAAALLFLSDYSQWDINQSSIPTMGFNGIAASFLGGLHPLGAIFSSYFIQHITDGGSSLDTRFYPVQIADLISAIIIYLCGFVLFIKLKMLKASGNVQQKRTDMAAAIKHDAETKKGGDK